MKQAEFVAFVQNVIMNFVVDIFAECSFRRRPPGKLRHCIKTKFNVKNLYTIRFCSYATNLACFIKFWSPHHVHETICHRSVGEWWIYVIYHKFLAITILGIIHMHYLYILLLSILKIHLWDSLPNYNPFVLSSLLFLSF